MDCLGCGSLGCGSLGSGSLGCVVAPDILSLGIPRENHLGFYNKCFLYVMTTHSNRYCIMLDIPSPGIPGDNLLEPRQISSLLGSQEIISWYQDTSPAQNSHCCYFMSIPGPTLPSTWTLKLATFGCFAPRSCLSSRDPWTSILTNGLKLMIFSRYIKFPQKFCSCVQKSSSKRSKIEGRQSARISSVMFSTDGLNENAAEIYFWDYLATLLSFYK